MPNYFEHEIVPCVINGKAHTTAKTFDLVDPHDPAGKVLFKVHGAQVEDADAAVDAAWAAFPAWSATDYAQRRTIFLKAAQLFRERIQTLIATEVAETTSTEGWASLTAGKFTPESIEETACCLTALRGEIVPSPAGQITYIDRRPFGVVLGMAPWNAPLILGVRAVRDAIAAGNTAILKTSENSPKTHLAIVQIFEDAGLPAGVLNVLHVAPADGPKVVERIISRREVRKVNFTGSTIVGSKIAEMCGRYLKPSVMELGGKAPLIILPSANLEMAASAAVFGGLLHSGQICMSTDVLLVHEDVAEKFGKLLAAEFDKLKADPKDAFLRGLFNVRSAQRLDGYIKDALDKGAKVVGGKHQVSHNIVSPVLLGGITDDMLVAREESFGPLITMRNFKTDDEVIKLANASDYGLSSAVYADDIDHAMRIARRIDAGACHINGMSVHDNGPVPHGGVKASGWGRFNSVAGLQEFTSSIVTTVNTPHKYM